MLGQAFLGSAGWKCFLWWGRKIWPVVGSWLSWFSPFLPRTLPWDAVTAGRCILWAFPRGQAEPAGLSTDSPANLQGAAWVRKVPGHLRSVLGASEEVAGAGYAWSSHPYPGTHTLGCERSHFHMDVSRARTVLRSEFWQPCSLNAGMHLFGVFLQTKQGVCLKGWISIPMSKESPESPARFSSLPGSISSCCFGTVCMSLCEPGQLEVDLFSVDFMAMLLLQATALVWGTTTS